jgi:hypothetical protein
VTTSLDLLVMFSRDPKTDTKEVGGLTSIREHAEQALQGLGVGADDSHAFLYSLSQVP